MITFPKMHLACQLQSAIWFVFIELFLVKNIVVFLLNCQIINAPRKNGTVDNRVAHFVELPRKLI